jgi:hypothetical protein
MRANDNSFMMNSSRRHLFQASYKYATNAKRTTNDPKGKVFAETFPELIIDRELSETDRRISCAQTQHFPHARRARAGSHG